MRWYLLIVLAIFIGACDSDDARSARPGGAPQTSAGEASLPVTSVTLFSSGSARIEHSGSVRGEAVLQLPVRSSDVAGVLGSIMVRGEDDAPGQVTVRPPAAAAHEPTDQRRIDLTGNPTMSALLEQLRGARVRIYSGSSATEGTLLSIERGQDTSQATGQIILLTGNGIVWLPTSGLSRIELPDGRAMGDLERAARSLWPVPSTDVEVLAVHLHGRGERSIRLSYSAELPAWQMSYRLMLGAEPTVQAWANIQNQSGFDWNAVQVTLASGRPLAAAADAKSLLRATRGAGAPVGEPLLRPAAIPSRSALDGVPDAAVAVAPAAAPIDAAEAFSYPLGQLSVPRGGSVLVPVFNSPAAIERVAVYNERLLARNALAGAWVRNSGTQYWVGGPILVFDEQGFAGEANTAGLAPGRQALIAYAIDVPLLVEASHRTHAARVAAARVRDGVLEVTRAHVYASSYKAENQDQRHRTLIVEHPARRGWRLVETVAPLELTESGYRFRMTVPAGQTSELTVNERIDEAELIDLALADVQTVLEYARNADVPSTVREALGKTAALKQRLVEAELRLLAGQRELEQLLEAQVKALEAIRLSGSPAPEELVAGHETQAAPLRSAVNAAKEEVQRARQAVLEHVASLRVGD
jgi:hypothetical protein